MESTRDNKDWDLRRRLQRSTWSILRRNTRGLPWIELSINIKKTLRVASLPASGVSVELCLGFAQLQTIGISTLTREEELALAGPVGRFDEAGDDGLGALWRSTSCR